RRAEPSERCAARGARGVPRARARREPARRAVRLSRAVFVRSREMQLPEGVTERDPIFPIAAASELSGLHPQTLRQYDRIGLVVPGRTRGGSRRYSARNIVQLREVARLSSEGVPLAVIQRMLDLENQVQELSAEV